MESSTGDKGFEQNMKIKISREKAVNFGKEMKIHFIVFRKDRRSNSILCQFCNSWIHTILILHRNTKRHTDTEIHREVSRRLVSSLRYIEKCPGIIISSRLSFEGEYFLRRLPGGKSNFPLHERWWWESGGKFSLRDNKNASPKFWLANWY